MKAWINLRMPPRCMCKSLDDRKYSSYPLPVLATPPAYNPIVIKDIPN